MENTERYFFISYIAHNHSTNGTSFGNIRLATVDNFPSNSYIKEEVEKINSDVRLSSITVTALFEFKNLEDFISFKK